MSSPRKLADREEGGSHGKDNLGTQRDNHLATPHADLHLRRGLRRRVLTFIAVCVRIHLATPLQRYCLPAYERSSAFGAVMKTHKSTYRLLFVGGPRSTPRPAMNDDVVLGRTEDPGGQIIPLALSAEARERGYSLLFRAPERSYVDARFSVYLKGVVYQGSVALRILPAAHSWRREFCSWSCCRSQLSRMFSGRNS